MSDEPVDAEQAPWRRQAPDLDALVRLRGGYDMISEADWKRFDEHLRRYHESLRSGTLDRDAPI